ncbi:Inosine-uridine preferring nucleoside hydrolase [Bacillus cereus Rock4-18]|nr:Inosine-uridine preferring nucleoside hydrolase [Bacillus cereus Rock4-18]
MILCSIAKYIRGIRNMERPVVIEEYPPDWALQFKEEQK